MMPTVVQTAAHRLWAIGLVLAAAGAARAECPEGTPQAACVLHEEAVVLLTSGRYEAAATKFRAAIAASPSARSYLGYAQAVEGQDKIALAYETMQTAKKLSDEELAASSRKDPAIVGRAERIRYKLSELAGRVGAVQLRLPGGVPPERLVSVHREGEGDLASPIGRWITVAPDRQVLIAVLDDGSQLRVEAKVAAGAQSHLVLPVPTAAQPQPAQPAQPQPAQPQPRGPRPRSLASLHETPPPPPPAPLPKTSLAAGLSLIASGAELPSVNLGAGVGAFAIFERQIASPIGLVARIDYLAHPESSSFTTSPTGGLDTSASGSELLLLAGLRTMTRTVHARLEAGVTVSSIDFLIVPPPGGPPPTSDERTDVYPVIGASSGLQFGRLRLQGGILVAARLSDEAPQMPIRFMFSLGIDLWRK